VVYYSEPQGSVLGLLLFLLYCIYGILSSGSKFEVFLLADDTNLMYKDKSLTLLESVLNEELANVCNWLFYEL